MAALNPAQHKYLYSVNPYFVYYISLLYLGGKFFAYAATDFDAHEVPNLSPAKLMPDGSTPKKIYFEYEKSVKGQDTEKLKNAIQRLRDAVMAKFPENEKLQNEIERILVAIELIPSEIHLCHPLIYLIDSARVVAKAEERTVSGAKIPEPTLEYIISDMDRHDFIVINTDPNPATRINNP